MLQRLTLAAAPHQLAEAVHLRRREDAFKIQVQTHARLLQQVRQQQLRLQPRRVHPLLGQELRAALNDFQNRHRRQSTCSRRRSKPKR
jgi:hypothetical protein